MSSENNPSPAPERVPLACDIELEYSDRANFAMQQNRVPLVDRVRLTLREPEPVENLTIELELENGDAEPWVGRLARLEPDRSVSLAPDSFVLAARQLATRTEAERSSLHCQVSTATGAVRRSFPIDLLAFDQWPGVGHFAELTAAFITPNHPTISEILAGARESLLGLTGSDALDGYQSGSRQRAAHLAEACFNALAARGIGYINPPASFETEGQRVRLVDRISREGMGTCLDLSLMLAGLWEQCGLHPLVLMPEGHAMPAIWTHEAYLPETVIDEPARIRNLIELGEIVPVESTVVTHRGGLFLDAVEAGKERMRSPGSTFHAIDIRSARKRGVRPLPLRDDGEPSVDLRALSAGGPAAETTSTLDRVALADRAEARTRLAEHGDPDGNNDDDGSDIDATPDRIARWQTRLLDLSLRNRLLNFRQTGRMLSLTVPDLPGLEDRLALGDRFRILPKAQEDSAFLDEELKIGHLRSAETEGETQKRLLNLYRIAKSSIEETGANVLYLSLGMLNWYESESSDTVRRAPLILLPVTLVRGSSAGGYTYAVSLSDEPLRPNVTLLEKLRGEFGIETDGLDEMPEDESGIDVPLILRNFRAAIRDRPKWEVDESACLGLFSFNKFLMWKDLQENMDRLKQNRLVGHLVGGSEGSFDQAPFPKAEELDEQFGPGDLLCTRNADSSQLAAVRAAGEGRTFVLEGPPGTGKSQTIANIIADTLARGRRVLFVAEKMAALSVVRKRLEQDGLGSFCLELHSAKASKKEVLAQLEEALEAEGNTMPAAWPQLCADLRSTRDELNAYVRAMHEPRGTGESLYRMIGRLSMLGEGPTVPPPSSSPADSIAGTTAEQLGEWTRLIASLQQRAKPVDPPGEFPLRGIGRSAWSFSLPDEARAVLGDGTGALRALGDALNAFLVAGGIGADPRSLARDSIGAIVAAAGLLETCPTPDRRLLRGNGAAGLRQRLLDACAVGRERDTVRAEILGHYREEFLDIDPLVHLDAVERHLKQPAFVRLFTAGAIKKKLRVYAKGALPPLAEVVGHLERVRAHNGLRSRVAEFGDIGEAAGPAWNSGAGDWGRIESLVGWSADFGARLATIDADAAAGGLADKLAAIASSASIASRTLESARQIATAWDTWSRAWANIEITLATDSDLAFGGDASAWLQTCQRVLDRWTEHLGKLNSWCTWRQARDAAVEAGLEQVVDFYERGRCTLDEIDGLFWRSFGRAWFAAVADSVEAVRTFNADAHTSTADRFCRLDAASIDLTRDVITAMLHAAAPAYPANASKQSELGILRRELAKQRRHLPTRRLIEAMPNLLPKLKPCFLMSPLSVAQYLDTGLRPFDLVVFDEASQIPVWDAIGAIARGTEVVVVGDSKQLPPTSFFSTLDGDDESEAEQIAIEDMESILKECNASGVPAMRLKWHYRSRHESLIAFSNRHYYQNELHTFPSPEDRSEHLGVSFNHVADGVYDRGGSRTNRVEAARVVDRVVGMLLDPTSTDSIGIVTFNQAQQIMIEDMLDAKRREHPEIEHNFTNQVAEPVFVKNLENVQGDERDTIIFSINYGPDHTGKPSMNFGPLNQDGGERRLNVAVTRAKRRLIVFSSLTSDQIDLRRTRATGVRDFKAFLDYAQRGPDAIADTIDQSSAREFDAGFERAIERALTDRGWAVESQVGCAGYRIDLAVRDPQKPGKFLVGIECDGATYSSAKTARDRDRIRRSVLEGLGWTMLRVWSTDWRMNPDGCLAKLCDAIEQAQTMPRDIGQPAEPAASDATNPVEPTASTSDASDPEDPNADGDASIASTEAPATSPPPAQKPIMSRLAPRETQAAPPAYKASDIRTKRLASLEIYDASATPDLIKALTRIVQLEAPITRELATRRLADAVGTQRITERFRSRFDEVCNAAVRSAVILMHGEELWKPDDDPANHRAFRVAGGGEESSRDLDLTPLIEIANAAAYILDRQFGIPRDELQREVAKLMGVKRITARLGERIDEAIDLLLTQERASEDNGQIAPQ